MPGQGESLRADQGINGGAGRDVLKVGGGGAQALALVVEEEDDGLLTVDFVEVFEGEDLGEERLLDDTVVAGEILEILEGGLLAEADAPPAVRGDRGGGVGVLVAGCNLPDIGLAEDGN